MGSGAILGSATDSRCILGSTAISGAIFTLAKNYAIVGTGPGAIFDSAISVTTALCA
ncbi:unnamed protein product [Prunus armeniaca]|uniref:Uncharacterized protein n=1 Tax=Prunus armeniaca TaxID=36596 RepID=A0A6J5WDX6_PRUAR|nr:unnamed protein product [Prunus armeniaca]